MITPGDTYLNFRFYYNIKGSREALAARNQICMGQFFIINPPSRGRSNCMLTFLGLRLKSRWGWLLGNRLRALVCAFVQNSG